MAYEDERTILPTGLLSKASSPKYIPKPINIKVPPRTKPGPTHVNVDIDEFRQRQMQEQQMNQKSGKIICTEFYYKGFISERIFLADQLYGSRVALEDPDYMSWYLHNAPWWVNKMRGKGWGSILFTYALWQFVRPWSEQMAFEMGFRQKGNWFGRFLMKCGRFIYNHRRIHCEHR